ncbi:MAG: DUF4037 domain-containing protein [Brevefilum sp.]|nr:DUF4037 domain-containing protein [Brevefilum sp.]
MIKFVHGLELSEEFFLSAVQPIMKEKFLQIAYAAARLDYGSDVLGFDTPMSMDHGWGPKLSLYLSQENYAAYHDQLDDYFANHLPFDVLGFPTNFAEPYADGGVMSYKDTYPIHHMIEITTPDKWCSNYLGVDIDHPISVKTWLTIPQQRLATLQAGGIYHDDLGIITEYRHKMRWYPHDIWLYLLANQWQRIDQDEPFIGRTGSVGDELGSQLISARLVLDLMRLGFLMHRIYTPYRKWFGSAFQRLEITPKVVPIFQKILSCKNWEEREKHLSKAYLFFSQEHNKLGLTHFIEPEISNFYDRPFLVPHAARFANALYAQIKDPEVIALPRNLGSIDQICDNTDILENIEACKKLRMLYE